MSDPYTNDETDLWKQRYAETVPNKGILQMSKQNLNEKEDIWPYFLYGAVF